MTGRQQWEDQVLAPTLKRFPERKATFQTDSGIDIPRVATPDDVAGADAEQKVYDYLNKLVNHQVPLVLVQYLGVRE